MSFIPDGNVYVNGNLACTTFSCPANTIDNAAMKAGAAGNYVDPTKLATRRITSYAQATGTDNVSVTQVLRVIYGATATLRAFRAYNYSTALSTDTTTIDLKKNGSTVLTAVITLNLAAGTTVTAAAGFTSAALVTGDKLTIVVTATGSDPGQGLYVELIYDEDPQ